MKKIILSVMLLFLCGCTASVQTENVTVLKEQIINQTTEILNLNQSIKSKDAEIKNLNEQLLICKGKPVQLKKFDSLDQLYEFLFLDKTNEIPRTATFDCEDYAMALCVNAFNQGYFMGISGNKEHAFNFTYIGNTVYGIEPQIDTITVLGVLD